MNETNELLLAIFIFILAALTIFGLMIYWSKNNTVVDERDKKYYEKGAKSNEEG